MRKYFIIYTILVVIVCNFCYCTQNNDNDESRKSNDKKINSNSTEENRRNDEYLVNKYPTVMIALLIRNKAHTLPYFFTNLENLNYPKDRIALWIRSDHNEDNSVNMIHLWLNKTSHLYHHVDFKFEEIPLKYKNESSNTDWPKERFSHLISLKEEALEKANQLWADYIFYIDADVFLTNPNTLRYLTSLNVPIIAPMLLSEGLYSNFWCGMTEFYYYHRTDEYKEIYNYHKSGSFPVPMIHSAVLINLNYLNSTLLTFDRDKLIEIQKQAKLNNLKENDDLKIYDGPIDDIIIFAVSAKSSKIPMLINNEHNYGYILMPIEKDEPLRRDFQQLTNIKVNMINDLNRDIKINDEFKKYVFYPERHKISLDHIYMINLERRYERRHKMEGSFRELGLDVEYFPAVDGRNLNVSVLNNLGIKFLPGYEDPYHHRQMTMGEVGCFLSHYYIWEKMIEKQQNEVLVLEDDIRFEPDFYEKAIHVLEQARKVGGWDLIYFGRKRLEDQEEPWVESTDSLVHVGYSYWTLGYVLTLNGAKKLLKSQPLKKLLPVDEFLPVMFNRHPNETWSNAFSTRNLIAFSAAPLLLYPTHYTGDDGYISDTEDSQITSTVLGEDGKSNKNDKYSSPSQNIYSPTLNAPNLNDGQHDHHHITRSIGKRDPGEL